MVSVVVLSRFPDIFAGFRECVDRDAPELPKLSVWDFESKDHPQPVPERWTYLHPFVPFKMAAYASRGWASCAEDDILYAGDDTRIIEPNTIARLAAIAEANPKLGILAARIWPHRYKPGMPDVSIEPFVAFVFVYIKRAVIDKIGYLDERFEGYGVEDVDFCVRARMAGFEVGFANTVTIKHGVDGNPHMSTFRRVKSDKQIAEEDAANQKRFAEKYGLPNDRKRIWQFVRDLK